MAGGTPRVEQQVVDYATLDEQQGHAWYSIGLWVKTECQRVIVKSRVVPNQNRGSLAMSCLSMRGIRRSDGGMNGYKPIKGTSRRTHVPPRMRCPGEADSVGRRWTAREEDRSASSALEPSRWQPESELRGRFRGAGEPGTERKNFA